MEFRNAMGVLNGRLDLKFEEMGQTRADVGQYQDMSMYVDETRCEMSVSIWSI